MDTRVAAAASRWFLRARGHVHSVPLSHGTRALPARPASRARGEPIRGIRQNCCADRPAFEWQLALPMVLRQSCLDQIEQCIPR